MNASDYSEPCKLIFMTAYALYYYCTFIFIYALHYILMVKSFNNIGSPLFTPPVGRFLLLHTTSFLICKQAAQPRRIIKDISHPPISRNPHIKYTMKINLPKKGHLIGVLVILILIYNIII